ncbi:LLM class flavin-dependent oxidoreductase [Mycobacterium celatum]|uniref:LLM class flavin-dependent oxidoreductase n=1 Tax=Mycobacterium celatum TaxID=28045 RepID=A0A2G5PM11_MYCCE|nr:LLM class flavin-dependent oxidoreductase [Mycobacterium celatum]PIB79342.1 LLM class flavin-dependent oxidoreductase [Mycobacterium celatum]
MKYTLEYPSELPDAVDDVVSGGRLIAGVGAGYLRSEFSALGVDFDRRAELLDEALGALRSIWTDPETPVRGRGFEAVGPVWLQPPAQRPHPPIWIGGNSKVALRRVVDYGSGWMPLIAPAGMASVIRTAAIQDAEQFGAALDELRARLADAGRDPMSVDVQVVCPHTDIDDEASLRHALDVLDELASYGATWAVVHVDGSSPRAALDFITFFGEAVVRTSRRAGPA